MTVMKPALAAALVGLLVACAQGNDEVSSSETTSTTDDGVGGATSATQSASSMTSSSTGYSWSGLPWTDAPCAEATQYVYLVEEWGNLYRFWPPTGEYTLLGMPACGDKVFAPWSMGVDKHAVAWIESNEDILRIDLATGACTDTGFDHAATQLDFRKFGMAFAKTGVDAEGERLFVWGTGPVFGDVSQGPRGLGWYDPSARQIQRIAAGYGYNTDLSSIGERLFGFENPAGEEPWSKLIEIDVETAEKISSVELEGVQVGRDWAMAAWGGDFYVFTDTESHGTAVARYRPSTGELSWLPIPPVAFHVIGAGVSTCAPTAPPPA